MNVLSVGLVLLLTAAILLGFLLRRMLMPVGITECDMAWLEDFSVTKYRPMLRLLSEQDYDFLALQAGYKSSIGRKLRTERRNIFRAYLRSLIADFHRLHMAARLISVYSESDRSDLAEKMIAVRLRFFSMVLFVEYRLMLHTLGIGTVDVRGLVSTFNQMFDRVQAMQPAGLSAAA